MILYLILYRKDKREWTRAPDFQMPGLNNNRTFITNLDDAECLMDKYKDYLCTDEDIEYVRGDGFLSFEKEEVLHEFILTSVSTTPNWDSYF